jgi:hypothetical protein
MTVAARATGRDFEREDIDETSGMRERIRGAPGEGRL